MKIPIFATFIVFGIWLTYELHKHRRLDEKAENAFWKKEHLANNVRKKSMDGLKFITIPFDRLPMAVFTEDSKVKECLDMMEQLKDSTIVNLTGISNTDLKLAYGTANITELTRYDENYTILARTLYVWGKALYHAGYRGEARTVLEFGIETGTDISGNYKILATIYQEDGKPENIASLIKKAETLNSAMKKSILKMLSEFDHGGQ